MVGNCQSRLFELEGARDEIVNAIGAVQERVFGMAMQMNERHL